MCVCVCVCVYVCVCVCVVYKGGSHVISHDMWGVQHRFLFLRCIEGITLCSAQQKAVYFVPRTSASEGLEGVHHSRN